MPVLEDVVVLIDEAVIKLVVALHPIPGDGYRGEGRSLFPSRVVDLGVGVVDNAALPTSIVPRAQNAPKRSR